MGKIKGQNFRVFVNGSALPEATTCTVTLNGATEDASTKDDVGSFAKEDVVSRNWTVTAEYWGVSVSEIKSMITLIKSMSTATVSWDQTAGAQNRVGQNAAFKRSGSAYLTDFTLTTPNRQNCVISLTFTGSGPLT